MNNYQKLILLAIITVFAMFMIYNLKFSDTARCVNAITKNNEQANSQSAELVCLKQILN